ncbi:MAG TPA: hypothetical protein VMA53_02050, partial [Stellaceae bacterium]|nr:hypothetical protein [Stellaceae bacterium]
GLGWGLLGRRRSGREERSGAADGGDHGTSATEGHALPAGWSSAISGCVPLILEHDRVEMNR